MNNIPDPVSSIDQLLRRALATIPNALHGRVVLDDGEHFAVDTPLAHTLGVASAPSETLVTLEAPISINSAPAGSLRVLCAPSTVPVTTVRNTIQSIADQVGSVLERAQLAGELAQTVQRGRFLSEVLDAVADASSIAEVVQTISSGIHHVLPRQYWASVQLALCDTAGVNAYIYELQGQSLHPYWRNVQSGVRAAGRDLAMDVEFIAAPVEGHQSQAVALANAIQAGVDGIAIAPINAAALEPLFCQARAAGIPLITFDSPPLENSASLLYVGIDNAAAGALAADVMHQLHPSGGVVALSVDSLQVENARQRATGFTSALNGNGLVPLPPLDDQYDAQHGQQLAQHTLQSHLDLCGVFGACGSSAANWARALAEVGRTGTVKLVCFDISADTIALLKAGTVQAVIAQREYAMGYRSVQLLHELITEGVEPVLARAPSTRKIDMDVDVVTLMRTPWSIGLADYLATVHEVAHPSMAFPLTSAGKRPKICVIGMAEQTPQTSFGQHVVVDQHSLLGHVLQTGHSQVIDPQESAADNVDVAAARVQGIRTLVGVPLRAQRGVLGMLRLESPKVDACSARDLAQLRQITSAIAVVVENAHLVGQLAAHQRELEAAAERQQLLLDKLLELSSPVVPIIPGILVLPLIGALDTARMTQINASVLAALTTHRASVVIVDITGAHSVDADAAQSLLRMAQAARLLGAEIILVGVSPVTAATLVTLGVDLSSLTPCADLAHGLVIALARRGARIVYPPRK